MTDTIQERIYADCAATTPVSERAARAWRDAPSGNPSSVHEEGRRAREAVERARAQTAALLHADPDEIVFTSGGTEADFLGISLCREAGRRQGKPDRFLCTKLEHAAVLESAAFWERCAGTDIRFLPVGADGRAELPYIKEGFASGAAAGTLQFANNETGIVQPVREAAAAAHAAGAFLHCDAVQGCGQVPLDVHALGADTCAVSGHKFYAPQGIGALYIRRGLGGTGVIRGGGQEHGFRGGTENVPGIAAFGEACAEAAETMAAEERRMRLLRQEIEREAGSWDGVRIIGAGLPEEKRLPGMVCLLLDGLDGEGFVLLCDVMGLAVSAGAACSHGNGPDKVSDTLTALGLTAGEARSAVRISPGRCTKDSAAVLAVLRRAYALSKGL